MINLSIFKKGEGSAMRNIGNKIRDIRLKHGHTLEELGDKLNFNPSNLSKIERGVRKPTIEIIEQLARIYDVHITYFFGEQGEVQEELKNLGAEWVSFVEEMQEKNFTPDEIKAIIAIAKAKLNKL